MSKVLFLTSPEEDYLSDGLLLGFRALSNLEVVDYPEREILCCDCPDRVRRRIRGHGFTLYTTSARRTEIDRFRVRPRLEEGGFDLVVVSDIWRQYGLFLQWRPYLNRSNTIIIDGADTGQVYPYAGWWWRRPYNWLLPRAHREFLYFKREWTDATHFNLWHRLIPRGLRRYLSPAKNLRPTAFSIPEEKIVLTTPLKIKDFARHIIDQSVAAIVAGSVSSYAFDSEKDYYRDLQASRYAVTMKRAGWDCLRHYEIAANGCVPCFRNLARKPDTCAPHGLQPDANCVSYTSAEDLMRKIAAITPAQYDSLQRGALAWAQANSCRARAENMLQVWRKDVRQC